LKVWPPTWATAARPAEASLRSSLFPTLARAALQKEKESANVWARCGGDGGERRTQGRD
jgi:hypothetical protein